MSIRIINKTQFSLKNIRVKSWLKSVIQSENFCLGEVSIVLIGKRTIKKMNEEFLEHTYVTDIITFDYVCEKIISGDLFICPEQVQENAKIFNEPIEKEMRRVMVHGILHLCGYKDKTKNQKVEMRKMENFYLKKLKLKFS